MPQEDVFDEEISLNKKLQYNVNFQRLFHRSDENLVKHRRTSKLKWE